MNRSGYIDDEDGTWGLYRGQLASAIRGSRGQSFLRELAKEMDAMPVKALIADKLVDECGECCTLGVVFKARGIDTSEIDSENPHHVGRYLGIAYQLAAEIEYENDEGWCYNETPEHRWERMRKWVQDHINEEEK